MFIFTGVNTTATLECFSTLEWNIPASIRGRGAIALVFINNLKFVDYALALENTTIVSTSLLLSLILLLFVCLLCVDFTLNLVRILYFFNFLTNMELKVINYCELVFGTASP